MRTVVLTLSLVACDSLPPPPSARSAQSLRGDAESQRMEAVDLGPRALAQVEIFGTVKRGTAPNGRIGVVVTDGPCFASGSHFLASTGTELDRPFRVELFPPLGTTLTVCAALLGTTGRATPWVARSSAPLSVVDNGGPTKFGPIDLQLMRGPPVQIPAQLRF